MQNYQAVTPHGPARTAEPSIHLRHCTPYKQKVDGNARTGFQADSNPQISRHSISRVLQSPSAASARFPETVGTNSSPSWIKSVQKPERKKAIDSLVRTATSIGHPIIRRTFGATLLFGVRPCHCQPASDLKTIAMYKRTQQTLSPHFAPFCVYGKSVL